jgi:hypothetical protein
LPAAREIEGPGFAGAFFIFVMPGLVPGIHVFMVVPASKTWMAGTPSAKTRFALMPGYDVVSDETSL